MKQLKSWEVGRLVGSYRIRVSGWEERFETRSRDQLVCLPAGTSATPAASVLLCSSSCSPGPLVCALLSHGPDQNLTSIEKGSQHLFHIYRMIYGFLYSSHLFFFIKKVMALPWWRSGWESTCQRRGHGFESWSGKVPHAAEQLSPCATTTEPAL